MDTRGADASRPATVATPVTVRYGNHQLSLALHASCTFRQLQAGLRKTWPDSAVETTHMQDGELAQTLWTQSRLHKHAR